ncbi:MAG TPA: helix-turn-helix transcriptional regulator [Dactylosporangium sp.]|jgi:transcriptional regulator with XRE-family HTH domain|nr:helix-turn-helix transcriptional regulator [Dactylosporangium sp.]
MSPDQHGNDLAGFLRARRTQLTPEQAGLPAGPGLRRTPGLRREELATLAGVSIDYYTRLERGKETRPSPAVVDSLARALHLEGDEHEHLRRLAARAARNAPEPPTAPSRAVRPGVKLLLENLRPSPAYVLSRTLDVLAANPGGLGLYAGIDSWPAKQRNLARYYFLHPAARDLFPDWDNQIRGCVARLRALAGTDPDAPDLAQLVGELLLKSPDFARLWERYDVRAHRPGTKHFRHPQVGDLTLGYQPMQLEGTPGHRLVVYYADVASPDHDAMVLLDILGAQQAPTSVDHSTG